MPNEATPAAPAAPITPPPAAPAEDANLLATILGMIKPEEKNVAPPQEKKPDEPAKPAAETPKASDTPPANTPPAATPDPAAATTPPAAPKKVAVKKKDPAPAPLTKDDVAAAVREALPATPTPERKPEPAAPAAPALPSDLTPEERDEIELYQFIEQKDPAKKGLVDKGLKFVEETKKFLAKRIEQEGADYDPATDPLYKKFVEANKPQITSVERRKFTILREVGDVEAKAYERARKELLPEIEKTRQKIAEIEETPKIKARLSTFGDEIAADLPEEIAKAYAEGGKKLEKIKEDFPLEYEAVVQSVSGAVVLAEDFLKLRAGTATFDPNNDRHSFIVKFLDGQAKLFAERGGEARVRDGKTFVHPYEFKPGMEKSHWTFDNEDVLTMLRYQASAEAKHRIQSERQRHNAALEAAKRRTPAPNGTTPPAVVPPPEQKSPVITPTPAPGAAAPAGSANADDNILGNILGFGTK